MTRPGTGHFLAWASLLAAAPLFATSCADILGVEDGQDAAAALCKCEVMRAYGSPDGCTSFVYEQLEAAGQTASWLAKFDALGCDRCGTDDEIAIACADHSGLCKGDGDACEDDVECCGVSDGSRCLAPPGDGGGQPRCEQCVTCGDWLESGKPPCNDEVSTEALQACHAQKCSSLCAEAGYAPPDTEPGLVGGQPPEGACLDCYIQQCQVCA